MNTKYFVATFFYTIVSLYANGQCSAPIVTSFSPLSAATGTTITITGNNFDATPENNIVYFGAAKAKPITASANQLTVNVPLGATYNYLTVTNSSCNLTGYSKQFFNPISICPGAFSASTVDTRIDFTSPDPTYGPYAILFGDFDLDGKTDVLYPMGLITSTALVIARNQSVPGIIDLSSSIVVSSGLGTQEARNCTIADIDGDGKLDIIIVLNTANQIRILRNLSSGPGNFTFAAPVILTTNSGPYQVASNDIDGDGKPELAVGHSGSSLAAIFRNISTPGSVSFAVKQDVNIPGYSIALADVDGDNNVDLVTGQGALRICRNSSTVGNISFSAVQTFPGSGGYRIAVGDLNGDGKIDVAASDGNVHIYQNNTSNGSISFASSVINTNNIGYHRVAISDLNADGKPDIMATYSGNNKVACALNSTSMNGSPITFEIMPILLTSNSCQYALGTADIDGDGNNDVLSGDWCSTKKLSVFRNNVLGLIPVTNSVSQTSGLVCNSTFEINYSAQCNGASPGNVYTAQLSDANGSFAVPINIGSVESSTSGTITGTIPSCIATGTGYRIRVVGSNPNTTGTVFGTPLSINCQTIAPASISTSSISPSIYCPGVAISVPYTVSGSFGVCETNTFTAQLSDAAGSFASPVNIGSVISNESGIIAATIPSNTPNGTSYRIRVISDQPQIAGTDNGSNITISSLNCVQLTCVSDESVFTDASTCSAIVNEIDPIITPTDALVSYTLSGATVGSGNGSVSGMNFNVGITTVTYTSVDDPSETCSFKVTVVDNTVPIITHSGDQNVNNDAGKCGADVTVSATAGDNCTVGEPAGVRSDGLALTDDYPVGTTTITWNVTDANGNAAVPVTQTVSVSNAAPIITSVTGPAVPNAINTSITLTGTYTDNNAGSITVDWGDSKTSTVSASNGAFTASHVYSTAGVYTVRLTLDDACQVASNEYIYQYVVIYDPSAGFVTGGGAITSPPEAYYPNPTLSGKATFGFVSKYEKGKAVPSGNTEFQFHAAGMNFKSTNYEWLVISGSKAQFKGYGTIDGSGNYGFLLSAVDGALVSSTTPDKFRIKIWDVATSTPVYDNQIGSADDATASTAIDNGSIIIHVPKGKTSTIVQDQSTLKLEVYTGKLNVQVRPNPSAAAFELVLRSSSNQPASLRVVDAAGRVLESRSNISANGTQRVGDTYRPGVYFAEVLQDGERVRVKLIKQPN